MIYILFCVISSYNTLLYFFSSSSERKCFLLLNSKWMPCFFSSWQLNVLTYIQIHFVFFFYLKRFEYFQYKWFLFDVDFFLFHLFVQFYQSNNKWCTLGKKIKKSQICCSSGIYRSKDESNKRIYLLIDATLSGRTYLWDKIRSGWGRTKAEKKITSFLLIHMYINTKRHSLFVLQFYKTTVARYL